MSGRAEHERGSALSLQRPHAVVDPTCHEHQPVHLDDLIVGQAEIAMMAL